MSCSGAKPHITAIDPHIGMTGQILTIMGEDFGDVQDESFVTIGGVIPTRSSYRKWSDNAIVVVVPDFGESGLIYVNKENQKSNPVLFSIKDAMPEFSGKTANNNPVIRQISPSSAAIGQLITISGNGFGKKEDNNAVFFSWSAEKSSQAHDDGRPLLISANAGDNNYESWEESEIKVYVPDGASSGLIEVHNGSTVSNAVVFEVSPKPGTKTINNKKTYSIVYSVDVRVDKADTPNTLYLWMPKPLSSASQINKELLSSNVNAFIPNYRGASLFRLTGIENKFARQISVSYLVDVYSTSVSVDAESVKRSTSNVVKTWLLPSALIPSDNAEIKEFAGSISKTTNPYQKARDIYLAMLNQFKITAEPQSGGALDAMLSKTADSYQAALLYCALCRASGIPSVPAAGALVDNGRQSIPHYWVEFWVDSLGSVPVDPALGFGAAPPAFSLREDHRDFYFGSMDNQHIAFSRDETILSQMAVSGRITSRERTYALQNIWEEASGGLSSYSTHWSDIGIIGVYSN
ncbi:hypothetical protein AGMMS50212_06850 [Spirochaetia bacterium]|nr:hypothetical protein AGMMS50212_06850 [Spirochaetia bacterium]